MKWGGSTFRSGASPSFWLAIALVAGIVLTVLALWPSGSPEGGKIGALVGITALLCVLFGLTLGVYISRD